MTEENEKRVHDALLKLYALTPLVVAMIDTLAKISKQFVEGSGFRGDSVLVEAARYLLGATAHLESASAGMLKKLEESKELIAKQEAE